MKKNSDRAVNDHFKYQRVYRPLTVQGKRPTANELPAYETYYSVDSKYDGPEKMNGRRFIIMDKPEYNDFSMHRESMNRLTSDDEALSPTVL